MKTPAKSERINLWKLAYARSSIMHAQKYFELHQEHWQEENYHIRTGFMVAGVICYARPFTRCEIESGRREIILEEDFVPQATRVIHEELINRRNRQIGHLDATSVDDNGRTLFQIILNCKDKKVNMHAMVPSHMLNVDDVIKHCSSLATLVTKRLETSGAPYFSKGANWPDGIYRIRIDSDEVESIE